MNDVLQRLQQMEMTRQHYVRLAVNSDSQWLSSVYRQKAQRIVMLMAEVSEAALLAASKTLEEGDNSKRMEMDPPSDRLVPVSGPVRKLDQSQIEANREAVFNQMVDAFRRGDGKHFMDLSTRLSHLTAQAA